MTYLGQSGRILAVQPAAWEDGRALFLKVLGRDERSADLMFRLYRFLRVRFPRLPEGELPPVRDVASAAGAGTTRRRAASAPMATTRTIRAVPHRRAEAAW